MINHYFFQIVITFVVCLSAVITADVIKSGANPFKRFLKKEAKQMKPKGLPYIENNPGLYIPLYRPATNDWVVVKKGAQKPANNRKHNGISDVLKEVENMNRKAKTLKT